MLETAPHKLQIQVITPEENDEYNRPIPGTVLGSHIRCLDAEGNTVGEGDVKKNAECYSEEFKGRCDIWV